MRFYRRDKDEELKNTFNSDAGDVEKGITMFNATMSEDIDNFGEDYEIFSLEEKLSDILDNSRNADEEMRTFKRISKLLHARDLKMFVVRCEPYFFSEEYCEFVEKNYDLKLYNFFTNKDKTKTISFVKEGPLSNGNLYLYFTNEGNAKRYVKYMTKYLYN